MTAAAVGGAAASFSLTNIPVLTGGSLSGSGTSAATPFNSRPKELRTGCTGAIQRSIVRTA